MNDGCATCENTGLVPIPRTREGYTQKLCPTCGGSSNPTMLAEVEGRREAARMANALLGRERADRKKAAKNVRKRQRHARRMNRAR